MPRDRRYLPNTLVALLLTTGAAGLAAGLALLKWVPAVAGLIFVTSTFFVFPPTREVRWMLGGFGAFAGLILFLIQAFDNPFSAPLRYPPAPLQRLLETELRDSGAPSSGTGRPGASDVGHEDAAGARA